VKVGFLTTSFPRFGGDFAGNFLLDEAKELLGQGVSVTILAPHSSEAKSEERVFGVLIKRFSYFWPSRLEIISYGSGVANNLKNPFAFLILPFFIASFVYYGIGLAAKVDLIHAQWAQTAIVARLVKFFTGRKYLVTVLGSDVDIALKGKLMKAFSLWGLRGADWIIAGNQYLFDQLYSTGIDKERLTKINMGIGDIESFLKISPPKSSRVGVFIGRLSEEKNLELVIRSLVGINNLDFELKVVGDGPERKKLEALAKELGVNEKIDFLGRLSRDQIIDVFKEGSFMILPQRRGGFGLGVLEAMAAARPVIHSSITGADEVIKNGLNGFLVSPDDEKGLARAIEKLVNDRQLLLTLGRNARQTAASYTWKRHTEAIVKLYRKALA